MRTTLEGAKFILLTACGASKTIATEQYRRVAKPLGAEDRTSLVRWLTKAGIEVRSELSMRALYHHDQGRKYRPTQREVDNGEFECPTCHVVMIMTTRKAKDPLFACPDCAWSIAKSDIWNPEMGEEPELRTDVEYDQGIAPPPEEQEGPW